MVELSMAAMRAELRIAKAMVLHDALVRRRQDVPSGDMWGGALTAELSARSSLAFLDVARAADRSGSWLAHRAAASGAC